MLKIDLCEIEIQYFFENKLVRVNLRLYGKLATTFHFIIEILLAACYYSYRGDP